MIKHKFIVIVSSVSLLCGIGFLVAKAASLIVTPSILPTPNEAGWNNADVTLDWAVDPGFGFSTTSQSGCDESIINTETSFGGTLFTCSVTTDEPDSNSVGVTIKLDKTAPVVAITAPANNSAVLQNQADNANWSATDALSGIDSSSGNVVSGSAFDTSSTGAQTFIVDAADVAGNTSELVNNYYVVSSYTYSGLTSPVTISKKTLTKTNVIPVKFSLSDGSGHFAPYAVSRLYVDGNQAVSGGSANVSNYFRFDTTARQYIFNLSGKKYGVTLGSHSLRIDLDDGSSYFGSFTVTK